MFRGLFSRRVDRRNRGSYSRQDRPFRYETNCKASDYKSITDMTDRAREITWETFIRHVPVSEVRAVFPSYSYQGEYYNPDTGEQTCGFHIKDDFAVSFHKSVYRGRPCYYIRWSAIEWIFTEG